MYCSSCGVKNESESKFCTNCGNDLHRTNTSTKSKLSLSDIPYEYKPITMWGYFGYQILFSIPIVGFILLLIFALGGTANINVRNFARSYFCWLIIGIALLLFIVIVVSGLTVVSSNANY